MSAWRPSDARLAARCAGAPTAWVETPRPSPTAVASATSFLLGIDTDEPPPFGASRRRYGIAARRQRTAPHACGARRRSAPGPTGPPCPLGGLFSTPIGGACPRGCP